MNSNQEDFDVGSYDIVFASDNATLSFNPAFRGRGTRKRKGRSTTCAEDLTQEDKEAVDRAIGAGVGWITILMAIMTTLRNGKPIIDELLQGLKPKARP